MSNTQISRFTKGIDFEFLIFCAFFVQIYITIVIIIDEFMNLKDMQNEYSVGPSKKELKILSKEIKSLLANRAIIFLDTPKPMFTSLGFTVDTYSIDKYFILQVCTSTGYHLGYIIVDLTKAKGKSVLDMDVPENLVGQVIGAGRENIKSIVDTINTKTHIYIRRINVHKIASEHKNKQKGL